MATFHEAPDISGIRYEPLFNSVLGIHGPTDTDFYSEPVVIYRHSLEKLLSRIETLERIAQLEPVS